MTPRRKFEHCLHCVEIFCDLAHVNVFKEHWQLSLGLVVYWLLAFVLIYGQVYTVANYDENSAYSAAGTLTAFMEAFLKYACIWDLRHMAKVLQYIANVYEINSDSKARDHELCVRFANYSQKIVRIVPIFYTSIWLVFISVSIFDVVCTGVLKAPLYINFPVVDGESMPTAEFPLYVGNFCIHSIFLLTAIATDTMVLLSFGNVPLLSTIIVRELEDFQKELNDKISDKIDIKRRLLKIILIQKKYRGCVQLLDEGFGRTCASQIGSAFLFTSLGAFAYIMTGSYVGLALAIVGSPQIALYCTYGTLVEISGNKISEALNSLDWYLLPKEERTLYLMLIPIVQDPQVIKFAKVHPLNMERSLSIFKTIYSYVMVLRNMVEDV